MRGAIATFGVEGGEVVSPGAGWVYAWCERGAGAACVVYVGATRLHPAARAEKHLRDPDPHVGRIRAAYPAAGGDLTRTLTVHAVDVGPAGRRALIKAKVAQLVREQGLLSPHWCGDPPAAPPEELTAGEFACARALVAALT